MYWNWFFWGRRERMTMVNLPVPCYDSTWLELGGESDVFFFFLGPMAASAVRLASCCLICSASICCISFAFRFNLSCSGSSCFERLWKERRTQMKPSCIYSSTDWTWTPGTTQMVPSPSLGMFLYLYLSRLCSYLSCPEQHFPFLFISPFPLHCIQLLKELQLWPHVSDWFVLWIILKWKLIDDNRLLTWSAGHF